MAKVVVKLLPPVYAAMLLVEPTDKAQADAVKAINFALAQKGFTDVAYDLTYVEGLQIVGYVR